MTKPEPTLEETMQIARRLLGRIQIALWLLIAAMVLMGIWIDWRWAATAVLPLAGCFIVGWLHAEAPAVAAKALLRRT